MNTIKTPTLAAAFALLLAACAAQPESRPIASAGANATAYTCESGATVVASYPDVDSAIVRYKGTTHDLRIARSADGARYVGSVEWWTKGSGVGSHDTLFRHDENGTSGKRLEFCTVE